MKKLSVLTGNQGKFEEIKTFLESDELVVEQVNVDLQEIQEVDALKIIEFKVKEALRCGYTNFMLEDTSLYIDGLKRLPGPLIKWFLGELEPAGLYALASSMGNGAAQAETIVAYVRHDGIVDLFRGATGGRIVEPRGEMGFGWAAIFQPDNCLKTYAQMTYDEKIHWNQRIKALKEFQAFFTAYQAEPQLP